MFFITTNDEGNPVADHHFYLYRYFIIRTTSQTSLLDSPATKEQLVIDVIKGAKEKKRVDFIHWKSANILYYETSLEDRLFYFKYAKQIKRSKKVDGGNDVVEIEDTELKAAMVVFDTKNQFVLIQNKTTEFSNTDQVKNAIETFLTDEVRDFNYTIKVNEMPLRDEFWKFIGEHKDHLVSLSVTFNAPNLFFGDQDTRNALRLIKEEFNNDETKIEVTSKDSKLTIGNNVRKYIEYIFEVGGQYVVKAREAGRWFLLSSRKAITSLYLPNHVDDGSMKELSEKLDDVNKKAE